MLLLSISEETGYSHIVLHFITNCSYHTTTILHFVDSCTDFYLQILSWASTQRSVHLCVSVCVETSAIVKWALRGSFCVRLKLVCLFLIWLNSLLVKDIE